MSASRRVSVWSGPRNVSTAFMYSWRQRSDTTVWDEPLYARYLSVTGVEHPGRDAVLEAQATDRESLRRLLLEEEGPTPVRFYKNMAHHLTGFGLDVLDGLDNVLLTREPGDVLPSLARGLGRIPTLADTGFALQVEILEHVLASGRRPLVVSVSDLLADPRLCLGRLCEALGLPFEEAMLAWPPGPKPEDGAWAPHWYERAHQSTGFAAPRVAPRPCPPELDALLDLCRPLHDRLLEHAPGPAGS